ncbi:Plant UBX domain-containing protein 1 [Abeliophyllum distichum]|uniref:Plant UBX domain-containing protein 1 n=1 Tax=Abeliophyllum distichum TaxID=126358 RepID=A0ABD1SXZ9_9LAMI
MVDSSPPWKRQRFTGVHLMDLESAKAKLAAAKEKFGRQIRVFETSTGSPNSAEVSNVEEPDDFFEFTAEDYYRLWATKKEDKYLKTRRIREAEEAARRSKITKAVIRVRFPDNYTLEAMFHPSETIQSLIDLLKKVVTHPELPLYIYTTPPKKQIEDMSLDFYSAGCVPGAIVYFAYDLPKGDDGAAGLGPFLQEEVVSLQGLEFITEHAKPPQPIPTPVITSPSVVSEQKPPDNRNVKPKWLKM